MRRQFPQQSMPVTPNNTFGLGIQVYKIQSKLPRINSGKNDRRQLIKQLENPTAKKYQKQERVNATYDKIIEKEEKVIQDVADAIRRKSILNTKSSTLNRISVREKDKVNRPPSGRVILRLNSSNRKQKETAPKPSKTPQAPSQVLVNQQKDKQRTDIVKVFPAFQNEQLRKFEDRMNEITLKRKQTKKNLRKQLKQTRDENEQEKILRKIQIIDMTDIVSQIVNFEDLAPYKTQNEFQEFGLNEYILREKGEYDIIDDDEEYELIYKPTVYISEDRQQDDKDILVPEDLIKELQQEQSTKNQQQQQ